MSEFSTNIERIINSPVNRSKSKHTYSFSKSMRFEEIKSPASKTFVYELPTLKSNRSTTMGYGKKFDFVIKHINKKVPFYEIPSDFNPKKPQTPAFSFGIAREFYDKVYLIIIMLLEVLRQFIFIFVKIKFLCFFTLLILGVFTFRKNIRSKHSWSWKLQSPKTFRIRCP